MRRTISITEDTWAELARRGHFGETPNDVLRRVFGIAPSNHAPTAAITPKQRRRRASSRVVRPRVLDGVLRVQFEDGPRQEWSLPSLDDRDGIRTVQRAAVAWALEQGATTPGQTNAIKKALTDAGYFIRKRFVG